MYESQATDLYVIRWLHSHCIKVHKNPYVWAANKTVVPTIIEHSCTNSTKHK